MQVCTFTCDLVAFHCHLPCLLTTSHQVAMKDNTIRVAKSSQPPVSQGVPKKVQKTRYATHLEPIRQGWVVEWLPIVWRIPMPHFCISESIGLHLRIHRPVSQARFNKKICLHCRISWLQYMQSWYHQNLNLAQDNYFVFSCEMTSRKLIQDCHKV